MIDQESEELLRQLERDEAATKIQAAHRGRAARAKLDVRLARKGSAVSAAERAQQVQHASVMERHLKAIGFAAEPAKRYAKSIVDDGFDTVEQFASLTVEELRDDFGLKRGHLRLVAAWKAGQQRKSGGKDNESDESDECDADLAEELIGEVNELTGLELPGAGVAKSAAALLLSPAEGGEQKIHTDPASRGSMLGMSLFTATKLIIETVLAVFFLLESISSCSTMVDAMQGCVGNLEECVLTMVPGEDLSGCGLSVANNAEYTQWKDGCLPRAQAILVPVVAPSAGSLLLTVAFVMLCIGRIVKRVRHMDVPKDGNKENLDSQSTDGSSQSKLGIVHDELETMKVKDTGFETLVFILAMMLFAWHVQPRLLQKAGLGCGGSFCPNDFEADLTSITKNVRCDESSVFITGFSNCTQLWSIENVTECSQSGPGTFGCCVPVDLFFPCTGLPTCTLDVCDVTTVAIDSFRNMYFFNAVEDVWDLAELLLSLLVLKEGLSSVWSSAHDRATKITAGAIIIAFFIALVLGLLLFLPADSGASISWDAVNDGCSDKPCGAHGSCMDLRDSDDSTITAATYDCICENGWAGATCEEELACASSPCQAGGGVCDDQDDRSFTCICNQGFTGELCADVGSPELLACPDIGLPGYEAAMFLVQSRSNSDVAVDGWYTSSTWQNGLRVLAQCGPLEMGNSGLYSPADYFPVDDPLARQPGCLFITSGSCYSSDADPFFQPMPCQEVDEGECVAEEGCAWDAAVTPSCRDPWMPLELSEAGNDDQSRTTAAGTCMITGCKAPLYADGSAGAAAAYSLQTCSTCAPGHPDWGDTQSCGTPLCNPIATASGFLTATCTSDGTWSQSDGPPFSLYDPVCVGVPCEMVGEDYYSDLDASTMPIPNGLSYSVSSQWPRAYPPTHKSPCRGVHSGPSISSEAECVAQGGTWNSCCAADPLSSCCTAAPWTYCKGGYGDVCEYTCAPGYSPQGVHRCEFETPASLQPEFRGGACVPNECTGGFTIPNSPTVCAGNVGDECIFTCDPGRSAATAHVCGTDGIFTGGTCSPCSTVLQEMLDWLQTDSTTFSYCPTSDVTDYQGMLTIADGKSLYFDGSGGSGGSVSFNGIFVDQRGVVRAASVTLTNVQTTSLSVWVTGGNFAGRLGLGDTTSRSSLQQLATLGSGVVQVVAGDAFSAALTAVGEVYIWGSNQYGQLANGECSSSHLYGCTCDVCLGQNILSPVQVVALGTDTVQLAVGFAHALALKQDGAVFSWGRSSSDFPALGLGDTDTRLSPSEITSLGTNNSYIATQSTGGMALKSDGRLFNWGRNNDNQLGDGTTTHRLSPVELVAVGTDNIHVVGAEGHALLLKADGSVVCWGRNYFGQIGNGGTIDQVRFPSPCTIVR